MKKNCCSLPRRDLHNWLIAWQTAKRKRILNSGTSICCRYRLMRTLVWPPPSSSSPEHLIRQATGAIDGRSDHWKALHTQDNIGKRGQTGPSALKHSRSCDSHTALPKRSIALLKMAVFWVVVPCSLVFRVMSRPDDGGSNHLWNVGKLDYTAQQPRGQPSSYSPPWKPEINAPLSDFA
jgi:hypothetical protein